METLAKSSTHTSTCSDTQVGTAPCVASSHLTQHTVTPVASVPSRLSRSDCPATSEPTCIRKLKHGVTRYVDSQGEFFQRDDGPRYYFSPESRASDFVACWLQLPQHDILAYQVTDRLRVVGILSGAEYDDPEAGLRGEIEFYHKQKLASADERTINYLNRRQRQKDSSNEYPHE